MDESNYLQIGEDTEYEPIDNTYDQSMILEASKNAEKEWLKSMQKKDYEEPDVIQRHVDKAVMAEDANKL